MKDFSKAFTLAEVLITLAIIGVVAAISIPSVISNSQQQEFRTGLRKAVSVLNSAITMNMALDGETPYDNANLFGYLMKHMAVIKTTPRLAWYGTIISVDGTRSTTRFNAAFYTTDGMRFEFPQNHATYYFNKLHESDVLACTTVVKSASSTANQTLCGGCGSYGLNNNPDLTTKPPCLIAVDVNGDRKPTPRNLNCQTDTCGWHKNSTSVPHPNDKKVTDLFSILITDKQAIPYGIVAQKAMYNSQK